MSNREKVTLHNNEVTLSGSLAQIEDVLSSAKLIANDLSEVSLTDNEKQIKLIITVPSIDTDVCATEAKTFNKNLHELLTAENSPSLLCCLVSGDLPFAQKRFFDTHKIDQIQAYSQFRNDQFSHDLGVSIIDGPLAKLCARAIFISIKKDGHDRIVYCQLIPEITDEPNYDEVIDKLKSLI